jgi:pantoate--beta-alanine ligase
MSGDREQTARTAREASGGPAGAGDGSRAHGSDRTFELAPTKDDLDRLLKRRVAGARVAVVMTMGALHEGHATLIRAARAHVGRAGLVVTTVFVNPLQFGPGEDLDRYPRTLDADLRTAQSAGADTVFAPSADEVYPGGNPRVTIAAGPMGGRYEGASRPGHFDGMLTVVAKLLHLTAPDAAFFGQKDAQQLALIRRMVTDLNFPVEIVAVPTVREDDGLALSSRNRYLSAGDRRTALLLSRALFAARDRLGAQHALRARAESSPATGARVAGLSALGEPRLAADAHAVACATGPGPTGLTGSSGADAVRAAAEAVLELGGRTDPPLALDYLALIDPADFAEVPDDFTGEAVLAVAARVGTTRLIDNIPLTFGATSG